MTMQPHTEFAGTKIIDDYLASLADGEVAGNMVDPCNCVLANAVKHAFHVAKANAGFDTVQVFGHAGVDRVSFADDSDRLYEYISELFEVSGMGPVTKEEALSVRPWAKRSCN